MNITILNALAEPNRFRIVELLRNGPLSVNDVAGHLKLRQPQASKHLKTLNLAGIVTSHRYEQRRIYSLKPDPFLQLDDWVNSFDSYWANRMNKLDNYLKTLEKE